MRKVMSACGVVFVAADRVRRHVVAQRLVLILPIMFMCVSIGAQGARLASGALPVQTPSVKIDLAHNSERERKTRETLEQLFATYDLKTEQYGSDGKDTH
jgi:hypothetical protein